MYSYVTKYQKINGQILSLITMTITFLNFLKKMSKIVLYLFVSPDKQGGF